MPKKIAQSPPRRGAARARSTAQAHGDSVQYVVRGQRERLVKTQRAAAARRRQNPPVLGENYPDVGSTRRL